MFARGRKRQREEVQELIAEIPDDDLRDEVKKIALTFNEYKFNPEFQRDWFGIYLFLRDFEQVKPYLNQIEMALQQKAAQVANQFNLTLMRNGKYKLPESVHFPYARFKIFSDFIYQWAEENGFKQRAKYIALQPQREFLLMLQKNTIFKDSSVTADLLHGSWSHAIQWFCIIEHQKATQFLQHDALAVFRSFGCIEQRRVEPYGNTAWDKLVDRFGRKNFTSPAHITELLSSPVNARRWPLLCGTVMRLEKKMQDMGVRAYTQHLKEKYREAQVGNQVITRFKQRSE